MKHTRIRRPILAALVTALLLAPCLVSAQSSMEEITISFEVPRLVTKDMFVQYDGSTVYLPLTEVFGLLDLNVTQDAHHARFQGFLIDKNAHFEIYPSEFKATVRGKDFPLAKNDLSYDGQELYLRVDQFQRLFGLPMSFEFSMLRVLLPLNEDFPAWQKLKRKQAREKLQQSEAALRDVRTVPRRREWFSGGVADWMFSANPIGGSGQYLDMSLGSMLLGGDLSISGSGNTRNGFESDQMNYRWHYAFDSNRFVTQAELGTINTGGFLSRSMTGGLVTNQPQVQRRYFQTINLDGRLDAGWEVELYLDGKLIDYAESDQSGEYHFTVDVMYGSSDITLKMYGPNGEIRTEEQHIRVPYTLVPKGSFEYAVAGGQADAMLDTGWFAQTTAYYGILNRLTVGLSTDIPVAANKDEAPLAAGEATVQVAGNLTANASFAPNYQALAGLNYTMPDFLSATGSFSTYSANSYRNPAHQLQSANLSLAVPIRLGQRYVGLRYNIGHDSYERFSSLSMNYGVSASLWKIYANYIGRYKSTVYPSRTTRSVSSQMLVSPDVLSWLRPQFRVDYDHELNKISRYGVYLSRRLFHTGQLSFSYENSPTNGSNTVMMTFNFFNSFANFGTRAVRVDGTTSMSQVQRGSIRYDRAAGTLRFDRRNGTGYGTAVVRPFLDLNNDGVIEHGEEYLPGLKAKIIGVGGRPVGRGHLHYYEGLRPYDTYTIQVDPTSLDNPMLKPAFENFRVQVNPNVVTAVDVPVVMAADITGMVERQTSAGNTGVGGITLMVLNVSKDIATEITTFSSGQFYYLGLIPGKYRAYLDPQQLERYGYSSQPASLEFEVKPSQSGSSIENINFVLLPKQ